MTPEVRLAFTLRSEDGYIDGTSFRDENLAKLNDNTLCLNLENASITDYGILQLPRLPNLRCIDLDGTQITDRGMIKLTEFQNLEELWIEQTAITDNGIRFLHDNKNLKFISIVDCIISEHAIARLEAAIPGILIH